MSYVENTYIDLVDIQRVATTKDANGMSISNYANINTDVSCGLSFFNFKNTVLKNTGSDMEIKPILFINVNEDIEVGDRLIVTTASGDVYKLLAGLPSKYPDSHQQVTCEYIESTT